MTHRLRAHACRLIACFTLSSSPAHAQTIIPIDPFPTSTSTTSVIVSASGSHVAGTCHFPHGTAAFRWTFDGGVDVIGTLADGPTVAAAISRDGSTVVGTVGTGSNARGFKWTKTAGLVKLPLPAGATSASAWDVTEDGSVVVGTATIAAADQAYQWSEAEGTQLFLQSLSPANSTAAGISGDGSSIAGGATISGTYSLYYWNSGALTTVETPPGRPGPRPTDLSADGSTVVGWDFLQALRWIPGSPIEYVENVGVFEPAYTAYVSADGTCMVGRMTEESPTDVAFLWTDASGILELRQYVADLGGDTEGWTLRAADGVTDDGTCVSGDGAFGGRRMGFIVCGLPPLAPACLADYNGTGDEGDILDFLDFIQDFSDCENLPAPCGQFGNADLNGDALVDILDFLDFMDSFGDGCS